MHQLLKSLNGTSFSQFSRYDSEVIAKSTKKKEKKTRGSEATGIEVSVFIVHFTTNWKD